jgi:hypothetical protein
MKLFALGVISGIFISFVYRAAIKIIGWAREKP